MDIEKIFENAKNKKMELMLKSVERFNSNFDLDEKDEKILNRVLEAMTIIDREYFCNYSNRAYEDTALPIGQEQTISQPSTVARMIVLLGIEKEDRVLEVGTGSGWNAAILAYLVGEKGRVDSIERISSLTENARENISRCRDNIKNEINNINLKNGNIFYYKSKEKYDKIIFTAGVKEGDVHEIKKVGKKLLREGGKLICPYTCGPIIVLGKNDGDLEINKTDEQYRFVPLIGNSPG